MPPRVKGVPEILPELERFFKASGVAAGSAISGYTPDPHPEARAYAGCDFFLTAADGSVTRAVFRLAKLTPTKPGLFVTLWKRDEYGQTRPYSQADGVDEFHIAAFTALGYGFFTFTAEDLAEHGVLSSDAKPGKRGFRLYTPSDTGLNPNASKTQAWQRRFFTVVNG